MKKITRMATLGVFLLAGVSGTALANGTSAPEPEPMRYMPPPPPPAQPIQQPVTDSCDTGVYISGAVGIGIPEEVKSTYEGNADMDTALALNGAIGYNFGGARLEAAVGYQKHDFKDFDDDISLLTVMGNVYYDIDTGSDITPYIMAGAGMAHVD
ncbi:MAG TPA: porin family protein, partial [Chlorobaculum parvum]|nr:porin family protein [Chlorobaculum parvum]